MTPAPRATATPTPTPIRDTDIDTDADTDTPIRWAGTWAFELGYTVTCDHGFGNMQTETKDKFHSVVLTGPNDALESEVAYHYTLVGSGSDDGFTLTGTFPFEGSDEQGALTSPSTNQAFFLVNTVTDADSVSGEVRGDFETAFVGDCELTDGTFVATR
jgi:hypothetical protein